MCFSSKLLLNENHVWKLLKGLHSTTDWPYELPLDYYLGSILISSSHFSHHNLKLSRKFLFRTSEGENHVFKAEEVSDFCDVKHGVFRLNYDH